MDGGGYVSHTESHRFSVHYAPAGDAGDPSSGDARSSPVFGACRSETRRLTGDCSAVTTLLSSDGPVVERAACADIYGIPADNYRAAVETAAVENREGAKTEGFYVSGKCDAVVNRRPREGSVAVCAAGKTVADDSVRSSEDGRAESPQRAHERNNHHERTTSGNGSRANVDGGPETRRLSPPGEDDSRSSRTRAELSELTAEQRSGEAARQHAAATDSRSDLADSSEPLGGNSSVVVAPHGREHRAAERADVAEKAHDPDRPRGCLDDCSGKSVERSAPKPNGGIHVDSASRTRDDEERRPQNSTRLATAAAALPRDGEPLYGRPSTGDVGGADGSRQTDRRNLACAGTTSKRGLESVDETAEVGGREPLYVGGFFTFGNAYYEKRPQNRENGGFSPIGSDRRKANFPPPGPDDGRADEARRSPWDEDCTVFAADTRPPGDSRETQRYYYSQLGGGGCCKTAADCADSDESLTDSLEDGGGGGGTAVTAVSYFLSLNGRESAAAVAFTLKMPGALAGRLDRRRSLLKRHLHAPAAATRKTQLTRVRAPRHKGCQTVWTEEKGVQAQRGSTAGRATASSGRHAADDRCVLETLLAGLHERSRVSENQIRLVAGRKMVSEGNQTEEWPQQAKPPTRDRRARTTSCRDAAAGPEAAGGKAGPTTGRHNCRATGHPGKKLSSDNAHLVVGVVRQNRYKSKEAEDGAKTDQLVTLSKGWINFYALRADSVDDSGYTLAGTHDNDDVVEPEDEEDPLQQYTVHVQAVPEPVTSLPAVVPNRKTMQLSSKSSTTCSAAAAAKHLPRLRAQDAHHRRSPSHLAATDGWCVSVDGPNNVRMKVSLLPEKKSDDRAPEKFDPNEDDHEPCSRTSLRAPQRKNNCARLPCGTAKRTQSTPKVLSADVSRTESALSAESKYIETVDTQLLIHKARRRLSQEWDARVRNGVAESAAQLVVTGDSVSSRAPSHQRYSSTRGHHQHRHCLYGQQSRRV